MSTTTAPAASNNVPVPAIIASSTINDVIKAAEDDPAIKTAFLQAFGAQVAAAAKSPIGMLTGALIGALLAHYGIQADPQIILAVAVAAAVLGGDVWQWASGKWAKMHAARAVVPGLLLIGFAVAGAACVVPPSGSNQVVTVLTRIANTATADLNTAIAVANAATPPDVDGAACAHGVIVVGQAMQKVAAATPSGSVVGAFTVAEIASLYQPGSDQFNWATKTLETACIAKTQDVYHAALSTNAVIAAIPSFFSLAAVP
jgi:hypothetical protein